MSKRYRWPGKHFEVDQDKPVPAAICDRCGFRYNLNKLQYQFDYLGSRSPQNRRILVCDRCYDVPNPQLTPLILSPDPPMLANARPETYALDETSWMTTQDDDIIDTQDGEHFITPIPNPADAANTTNLFSVLELFSGDPTTTAYLDLFDGDPSVDGTSVLAAITGSSTRTNVANSLTVVTGDAVNPRPIVVASASARQTNISFAGFYDAATGGTLIARGPVSVSQTIAYRNPVRFNSLGLRINVIIDAILLQDGDPILLQNGAPLLLE